MDVLLSIKPKFAESIISGIKKYEFRKNAFSKKNIGRMYIYSTTPIKKVIGIFKINKIIEDKPSTLWHRLKDEAGISEEEFFDYFKNRDVGFAFEIVDVERFETPLDPKTIFPNFVPPQSFCYINYSFMLDEYGLKQNLSLVGKLDDSPENDIPRERFRSYLRENVNEVGRAQTPSRTARRGEKNPEA